MTRPFKGLGTSKGPDEHYDAIVIGAGIGGLICANLLARNGHKVLLVERHYMVGGFCSTFRRKGFVFDAASHFYPLLGNASTLTGKLIREIGVTCKWAKMDPVDHFHFPDNTCFRVAADLPAYRAQLDALFPAEAESLKQFFRDVKKAYMGGLLYYFKGQANKLLDPFLTLTVRQVLDKYFQDLKLKLLLTADGPHWGAPPKETSFVFDSMLRLSYFLGNYYPEGGSQVFADQLAACFEQLGGHILMKSSVERILVEDGIAQGVEVDTGPRHRRLKVKVHADRVISNADMLQTLETMVGVQHLEPEYMNGIHKLKPSYPCFLTHLGLRDVSTDFLRDIQGYHWNEWNPDLMGRGGLRFKIFVPTLFEPQMAPTGCHTVIIQKVLDMEHHKVTDWSAHKAEIEAYILTNLGHLIPDLENKIVVKSSASAMTSFRFTGNWGGAMLGWAMSPDQLGMDRPDIQSPITNLYFTGHWTRPGGGITPVIESAKRVAGLIGLKNPSA